MNAKCSLYAWLFVSIDHICPIHVINIITPDDSDALTPGKLLHPGVIYIRHFH